MLIDWQGCGFDLVSNDLMWCLYGFIKVISIEKRFNTEDSANSSFVNLFTSRNITIIYVNVDKSASSHP